MAGNNSQCTVKYVYCNSPIQLVNLLRRKLPIHKPKTNLVLSTMAIPKQIEESKIYRLFEAAPVVTAYYENRKINRNIFIVERVPGSKLTGPLLYGEEFYIRLRDTEKGKLYLMGVMETTNSKNAKNKATICLVNQPNGQCKFKCIDPHMPDQRVFLIDVPIESFKTVCLVHIFSGQKLAVLLSHDISKMRRDHEVCALNVKGRNGRKCSENFWKFFPVTKAKLPKETNDVEMDVIENA